MMGLVRVYPALVISSEPATELLAELIAGELYGFDLVALDELDGAVRAFFSDAPSRERARAWLGERHPAFSVSAIDVPDDNWAERSQAMLKAVKAGVLTIAPPWDAAAGSRGSTILIEPSMGFGTGHHATTRLCLEAMQDVGVNGRAVLDVGTGSGVLAIAAARLGARHVIGIDNDPDAIDNARTNMRLNGEPVEFRVSDLERVTELSGFDVVLANLTGATLMRLAAKLESLTAQSGWLILSGLRDNEEDAVVAAFRGHVASRESEDGWVCVVMRAQP